MKVKKKLSFLLILCILSMSFITIATTSTVAAVSTTATAIITADNYYSASLNGTKIGSSTYTDLQGIRTPETYSNLTLRPGKNVLALSATNVSEPIAGILAELQLSDGRHFVTNATWKVSTTFVTGWQTAELDDSSWANATEIQNTTPWGPITGISTSAKWIWTAGSIGIPQTIFARLTFYVDEATPTPTNTPTKAPTSSPTNTPTSTPTKAPTSTPTSTPTNTPTNTPTPTGPLTANIVMTADNHYSIFLNGTRVGITNGLTIEDIRSAETYSNLPLRPGKNVISISAKNESMAIAGILADVQVSDGRHFVTNSNWKVYSATFVEGWQTVELDDSGWANATEIQDTTPWGPISGVSSDAKWIWTAGEILIPQTVFARFTFYVDGPTYTPTNTPANTPTNTPTSTPTNTPVPGTLKIQYSNNNAPVSCNNLYTYLKVVNTGTTAVNLANVKLKYYFTADGTQTITPYCDYATAGSSNVFMSILAATGTNTDKCLEVGFASTAGTLAPGASSEIYLRMTKSDWSNFNQANDYSYNAAATSFTDWNKVTAYISGVRQWGVEP